MGKGDIRTRRGKVWRGTYGVTRPRRYKTVIKPRATTRKAKTLKDLPKVTAEAAVKKPVAEAVQSEAAPLEAVNEAPVTVSTEGAEGSSAETEAGTAAKKPRKAAVKKPAAAKKAPKKTEE